MTLDIAGSASARSTRIAMFRGRLPCPRASAGRWRRAARRLWRRRRRPGCGRGVEHPFRIIKRVFGCDMVRYRGLDKNVQRLALLLGFSNLMIAQPHLQ